MERLNIDFKIIKGSIPALVSAPHAKPQIRPGFDSKKPKINECNTDLIVEILCQRTDCFGIYATKIQKVDPNWYEDSPYKKAIEKFVNNHDIKFVLDIHGMRKDKLFMVEYDDFKREDYLKKIEENLKNCLKRFSFSENEISRGLLRKNDQLTITEFCIEKLKIPALQLEINQRIRDPQNPKFGFLLSSLECFLQSL